MQLELENLVPMENTTEKNNRTSSKAPIASMDVMEDTDFFSGSSGVSNNHLVGKPSVEPLSAPGGVISAEVTLPPPALPQPLGIERSGMTGIKYRNLGKSGLKVSNVGLGSMKLFTSDNPADADAIVTAAYERGVNFFEVASDPWQQDRHEKEFGRIFARKAWPRRSYVVVSRVYWSKYEDGGLSRKEIIEAVKKSLENLQLDYIDLVLIHKADPNCTMEEIVRAMTYLINSGQIMYWGTSRWSTVEIYEAFSIAKCLQCIGPLCEMAEYHWFHREKVELFMGELYNKIGFGLTTWSPVSFGLNSGGTIEDKNQLLIKLLLKNMKYNKGPDCPNMSESNTEAQNKLKQLASIAEKNNCTLNQLCIAWSVRNNTSATHVLSASSKDQIIEALNSLAVVKSLSIPVMDDFDRVLGNKPSRPPMISTLQQRWATTGGVPPC